MVADDIPLPSSDQGIEWEDFWENFLVRRYDDEHAAEAPDDDPQLDRLHRESMKLLARGEKATRLDAYLPQEKSRFLSLFRFQLSTLLIGMATLAVILGIVGFLRQPTATMRRLEALRCHVDYYHNSDVAHSWGLKRLWDLDIYAVTVANNDFTDSDLAMVAALPLVRLSVNSDRISDAGLANLAQVPNLYELEIEAANITDQGFTWLSKRPSLRRLTVVGPKIGGKFLDGRRFDELENLHLSGDQVDDTIAPLLARLWSVRILTLYNTNVTHKSLPSLQDIHRLEALNVLNTRIDSSEVESFNTGRNVLIFCSATGSGPIWPSRYEEEMAEMRREMGEAVW